MVWSRWLGRFIRNCLRLEFFLCLALREMGNGGVLFIYSFAHMKDVDGFEPRKRCGVQCLQAQGSFLL